MEGEFLRLVVARPGEGEDTLALVNSNLSDDMGRGAKAVDANSIYVLTCQSVCPVADHAGTQKRCDFTVGVSFRQCEAVALISNGILSKATIDGVASEERVFAQILLIPLTVLAGAVRVSQPGYADALSQLELIDILSQVYDSANDLVSQNKR